MPKPSLHALPWSEESHRYELSTRGHSEQWFVPENEEPWLLWLETQTSFSFQGQRGRMTVIKEARPRGAGYWYAYHCCSIQHHSLLWRQYSRCSSTS